MSHVAPDNRNVISADNLSGRNSYWISSRDLAKLHKRPYKGALVVTNPFGGHRVFNFKQNIHDRFDFAGKQYVDDSGTLLTVTA